MKPIGEALRCDIGYLDKEGRQVLLENNSEVKFTSQSQFLTTTLPPGNGEVVKVFTRCYDSVGRTDVASVNVKVFDPLDPDSAFNSDWDQEDYERFATSRTNWLREQIDVRLEAGQEIAIADIVALYDSLGKF